jgi:hypothetical protein
VFVPPLPTDINDLKRRITKPVAAVTCHMLRRVWEELDFDLTSAVSNVGLTSSACKV